MAIERTTGALIGTSESSLQSISAGATHSGSEVDILGDDESIGEAWIYLVVTAASVSTIELTFNNRRVTGQNYQKGTFDIKVPTINGTRRVPLGKRPVGRFMQVEAKNNAVASSSVFVGYELEKAS